MKTLPCLVFVCICLALLVSGTEGANNTQGSTQGSPQGSPQGSSSTPTNNPSGGGENGVDSIRGSLFLWIPLLVTSAFLSKMF